MWVELFVEKYEEIKHEEKNAKIATIPSRCIGSRIKEQEGQQLLDIGATSIRGDVTSHAKTF